MLNLENTESHASAHTEELRKWASFHEWLDYKLESFGAATQPCAAARTEEARPPEWTVHSPPGTA